MIQKEREYTTKEVAKMIGVSPNNILHRASTRGIKGGRREMIGGYTRTFTEPEILEISISKATTSELQSQHRQAIIAIFTTSKDNSTRIIAEKMSLPEFHVSKVINTYLQGEKFIVLESKINFEPCQSA